MKAYNLHKVNDLRYEDIDEPEVKPGWCLVQLKATGICSSDIPRIFSKGTYYFPTIPGHEFSGIVKKVGLKGDNSWINKRVGVFPLIPCQTCEQCLKKQYEMCYNYDYLGSRRDGGFAEYVTVPIWNLLELPDEVTFTEAAMLEPVAVALHAIKRTNLGLGHSIAIVGTGMIGFAAAQWAKFIGASQVYMIGRNLKKKQIAERVGIEYFMPETLNKLLQFDAVLEAVGDEASIELSINLAKAGGNVVLMGNPAGDISFKQNTYWRILRKQLTIKGTWNSFYESGMKSDWTEACEAIATGKLNILPLISHRFNQEDAMNGFLLMKNHNEPYCKVIIEWNSKEHYDERR